MEWLCDLLMVFLTAQQRKKKFTFTADDKFFTSVIQLRTDFSTSGVYTSCFNHNWCKLLRLALKIPVESFG